MKYIHPRKYFSQMYRLRLVTKIFGRYLCNKVWVWWQLHVANMRHLYSKDVPMADTNGKTKIYVYVANNSHIAGGIAARLFTIMTVLNYCRHYKYDFRIDWNEPCSLQNYLEPNKIDWLLKADEKSTNLKQVKVLSCSYLGIHLDSDKPINHVYGYGFNKWDKLYKKYFDLLFKPSKKLQVLLDDNLQKIGGDYVSLSFRFVNLLGDFKDDKGLFPPYVPINVKLQQYYILKCRKAIEYVHEMHHGYKVLVTADSMKFLSFVNDIPYVYVVPGKPQHVDYAEIKDYESNAKQFLDLMMIKGAKESYQFVYGKMRAGAFAGVAASVDGRYLKYIDEKNGKYIMRKRNV